MYSVFFSQKIECRIKKFSCFSFSHISIDKEFRLEGFLLRSTPAFVFLLGKNVFQKKI